MSRSSTTDLAVPPVTAPPPDPQPVARRRPGRTGVVLALFLAPALLLMGVYLLWPIAQSLQLSLFRWDGVAADPTFIGGANWRRLLGDDVFWLAFRNNLVLVVVSLAVQLPIAMALAVLLDRVGRRLARALRLVWFVPLLLSTVAVGVLFRSIYDNNFGLLNAALELVGLDALTRPWLGDPGTALPAVIMVVVWQFVPFYMLLFAAGLADLPGDLRDAARVDGATENQFFWRVALPNLKPLVGIAAVLSLIGALKYFDIVWVMTGGGPVHRTELMATYMFTRAFRANEVGYGATIASALFLSVLVASLATTWWTARRRRREVAA